jgi:chemotaxis response regulator CheB
MKNVLILHSSALVRQWISGICRGEGAYAAVLSAGSFEIALVKFEGCVHNILLIEDRLLDQRTRAWIVDRRHRCDEHLLIIHREPRIRDVGNSFVLERNRSSCELEAYREGLLDKIASLSSSRVYEDIPLASGDTVVPPQVVDPHPEKIHPDEVLPFEIQYRASRESRVIVLGASTGGTEAIHRIIKEMDGSHPPLVMVQHMPDGFLAPFAENLSRRSGKTVVLAQRGMIAEDDALYLMPGGFQGLVRCSAGDRVCFDLLEAPPVSRHRPSVNILFRSAAMWFGPRAAAVLLTGMGDDGVIGMGEVYRHGGHCIIQDEESSVVFGMPGEAKKQGCYHEELAPGEIARRLPRLPWYT